MSKHVQRRLNYALMGLGLLYGECRCCSVLDGDCVMTF